MSSALRDTIKRILKRSLAIGLGSFLTVGLLAYAVDYAVFRYRLSTDRQPFGQITVSSYDAVLQKNGKTAYLFDPPQQQTCANSLFPRNGYVPCWYLQRHTEPRTDI